MCAPQLIPLLRCCGPADKTMHRRSACRAVTMPQNGLHTEPHGCGAVVQARHIGLVKVGDQVVVNQCPSGSDSGSVKVRSPQKFHECH